MAEVITDERMRTFVHSKVSTEFGLSVEKVADQCKTFGRFKAWLNSDVNLIIEVLNKVKSNGVSPAFFASYEKTEGYNSKWGWLNHTSPAGGPVTDSDSVSKWIVSQSNNTTDRPAWIDYANYKDFVPSEIKSAGNADFQNMSGGSIGKVVIAGTAAATWEVYYPNGLKAEYNGVQNYAAPINGMMDTIEAWGGSITDSSDGGGGEEPTDPGGGGSVELDFQKVISEVLTILSKGKIDLENSFSINTDGVADYIVNGLKDIYNAQLYQTSQDFYTNVFFKLTKTYERMMKLDPTTSLEELIRKIVDEAMDMIEVTFDIDGVFSQMETSIKAIKPPSSGGGGTPDPGDGGDDPSTNVKKFPVKIQNGINFWKRDNWAVGTLQRNMTYGMRSTGQFHFGYDIGAGGVNHPIYSMTSGVVERVGTDSGIGNIVIIKNDHDEYYIQYGHLDSYSVKAGDKVSSGDQIAIMGDTGGNYAIHLDVKISTTNSGFYAESTSIDPEGYLGVTGDNATSLAQP